MCPPLLCVGHTMSYFFSFVLRLSRVLQRDCVFCGELFPFFHFPPGSATHSPHVALFLPVIHTNSSNLQSPICNLQSIIYILQSSPSLLRYNIPAHDCLPF